MLRQPDYSLVLAVMLGLMSYILDLFAKGVPTLGVTSRWGGHGGTPSNETKAEVGQKLVKRADSSASGARFVWPAVYAHSQNTFRTRNF